MDWEGRERKGEREQRMSFCSMGILFTNKSPGICKILEAWSELCSSCYRQRIPGQSPGWTQVLVM